MNKIFYNCGRIIRRFGLLKTAILLAAISIPCYFKYQSWSRHQAYEAKMDSTGYLKEYIYDEGSQRPRSVQYLRFWNHYDMLDYEIINNEINMALRSNMYKDVEVDSFPDDINSRGMGKEEIQRWEDISMDLIKKSPHYQEYMDFKKHKK